MQPTKEQIKTALQAAERMHQRDLDPHHMARTLRYLHSRNAMLEDLLMRTDRFVRFGMSEQELGHLRRLVMKLREEEAREEDDSEIDTSMLL